MVNVNDIDWNEAWKKPESDSSKKKGFLTCSDRWSDPDRCKKFSQSVQENNFAASRPRIHAMNISPDFRILDVGAGPGTLAVPLAGMVRHVTAVEPSECMRACLSETMDELSIRNITIVPKLWEDVDISKDLVPPYDLVVASYSLGFPDLREGLLKMAEVSSLYVYIFWFADMISPWQKNYGEIWEPLYGISIQEYRKPNIIFNLLHQMGIYANVEVTKEEQVQRFSSIEQAVQDQGAGLNLTTPEQFDILRKYLGMKLQEEGGVYVLRSVSPRAMIWWKRD
ncbi:MAG TPA: class I SAM-dependent methyltransferase [Methanospirillum sp.]|nr:class I SAM-dependent methyltransferase [Methanospirillum sp.]